MKLIVAVEYNFPESMDLDIHEMPTGKKFLGLNHEQTRELMRQLGTDPSCRYVRCSFGPHPEWMARPKFPSHIMHIDSRPVQITKQICMGPLAESVKDLD